jgi:hypothetical protein
MDYLLWSSSLPSLKVRASFFFILIALFFQNHETKFGSDPRATEVALCE